MADTQKTKPNVLLIMTDQWRGDCLGIMGHPTVETPYLDSLARSGVSFDSAYSAVPTCIAARAALFTGMSQSRHRRVGYQDNLPWTYPNMMAKSFSQSGYHTQAVGKMHVYPSRLRCGFDNVVLHDGFLHAQRGHWVKTSESADFVDDYVQWAKQELGHRYDIMDAGVDCNSFVVKTWPYPEYTHPTNWVTEQSLDFLRRRDPTQPFFLFASYHRPHAPYDPPQSYYDDYRNVPLEDPPVGDWEPEDHDGSGWNAITDHGEVRKSQLEKARRAYFASMTHIDHQIGRLLSGLGDSGDAGNTIVLFVSDHGDLLGDHRRWRKSSPLEGASRIPLILMDPTGQLGLKAGTVSHEVAELRDVMPTLLDACGIEIPETVDGKSLLGQLNGSAQEPVREYLHGEHRLGSMSYHMIRHRDGMKYAWFDQTGEELLFDLNEDPEECHNLIPDAKQSGTSYAARLGELRQNLIDELGDREEGYVQNGRLVSGRPTRATLQNYG